MWGFVVAQCGGPRHYADRIAALEVADAVSLTRTLRALWKIRDNFLLNISP